MLELHGQVLVQEGGYWVKIEARRQIPSQHTPHGIRYSLTLHEPSGARVLGFDNAHALPRAGGRRIAASRVEYDHWHPDGRPVAPYEFVDAGQLLEDFFAAVDQVLKRRGVI
ncbi:MAG: hypothetical protein ACREU6_16370 [Steroidobacteraceae bacterium]